jgi:two-component system, NtrC family, response regulator AtoC
LPKLADHIVGGMAKKYRLKNLVISESGKRRLMAWQWPGNVRELAHEIERAVVLSMGAEELDFSTLPVGIGIGNEAATCDPAKPGWFNDSYRFPDEGGFDMESAILHIINQALAQTGGNVSAAARLLGVPRDYLRYRLKNPKAETGE